MENIEQPNLKGAVFSWASLTGITFSHVAAAAATAFGGQVFLGADSGGSAAVLLEQRGPAGAHRARPRVCNYSCGIRAQGQHGANALYASSLELAQVSLGRSQRVAVCIRPRRHTLRLERYRWVILNDIVRTCTLWEV